MTDEEPTAQHEAQMPLSKQQRQRAAADMGERQRERADAFAEAEWQRALAAGVADRSLSLEEVFKASIRTTYRAATTEAHNEQAAELQAAIERRQLREAGRDPDREN